MKKTRKVVNVHNDMLQAPLGILASREIDLMINILYTIKDKGCSMVVVPSSVFSNINGKRYMGERELESAIDKITDKLQSFRVKYVDEDGTRWKRVIFPHVGYNSERREVLIEVNEWFEYIVNKVFQEGNFTSLSCVEMTRVNGKHSKLLYWHLKRFSNTGVWMVSTDEFKKTLNIQKHSVGKMHDRVIYPALEELKEYFPGLKYYEKQGARGKVSSIAFVYEKTSDTAKSEEQRRKLLQIIETDKVGGEWVLCRQNEDVNSFEEDWEETCPF